MLVTVYLLILCYVYECSACVCMCTMYVLDALGVQKSTLGLLEVEFRMVLSHHVGAGNQTMFFCKNASALSLQPTCW